MQKWADIALHNKEFILSGDLNFSNVLSLYQKSIPDLPHCQTLAFNFSQVNSSDSSGLALIIEWMKYASRQNKAMRCTHLSADLIAIASAAGLEQIIRNSR